MVFPPAVPNFRGTTLNQRKLCCMQLKESILPAQCVPCPYLSVFDVTAPICVENIHNSSIKFSYCKLDMVSVDASVDDVYVYATTFECRIVSTR